MFRVPVRQTMIDLRRPPVAFPTVAIPALAAAIAVVAVGCGGSPSGAPAAASRVDATTTLSSTSSTGTVAPKPTEPIPTLVAFWFREGLQHTLTPQGLGFPGACDSRFARTQLDCQIYNLSTMQYAGLVSLTRLSHCQFRNMAIDLSGSVQTRTFDFCSESPELAFTGAELPGQNGRIRP